MGDYGIRVAQPGYDVKTCNDKHCVLTSKYSLLKSALEGKGTASYSEGSEYKITITHNLGYIPFINFMVDVFDDGKFRLTPSYDSGALYERYYYAKADSSKVYLIFYDYLGGSSTITQDYEYKIYLDKGKL